ncbi:hypothetical protein [Halorubrum sp. BV1]|uniref:hypothetical protein n=1 Tax=Halorubrum sp. BV1 TaxID=1498500 RepID=UPI0006799220|nr:hypothetical protein [Halorubrum sp. BV1]
MSEESERVETPEGSGDAGDEPAGEETKGIREGVEESTGDPRLILLLNAVLSGWLAWTAVWGLDLLAVVDYSLSTVGGLAAVIFALTYVVVLR